MATAATARASVKNRLGIKSADTTWDTLIDDFVAAAVLRLYPRATLEVDRAEITPITVDSYGECEIDLSSLSGVRAARKVEGWDGYTWETITDLYHHGSKLLLRGVDTKATKVRLYGLKPFPAIDNVQDWLLQAVFWYAMAEFYDYLAGSSSDYNIYMQNTGARAVDNMRDESTYFDLKADNYIDKQART
jgi:hypothetical protein